MSKTPEQEIADTFGVPTSEPKPVPTFVQATDRIEQEFSSRRVCEGCGRARAFDVKGRLRGLVRIDDQPWHHACWTRLHPGRTA